MAILGFDGQGFPVTAERKPRLRFKREPNEQGLAAVCQSPRGYELWYGETNVGQASEITRGIANAHEGTGRFGWAVGSYPELGIEHANTYSRPARSMEEAKAALRAHVEAGLKAKGLR